MCILLGLFTSLGFLGMTMLLNIRGLPFIDWLIFYCGRVDFLCTFAYIHSSFDEV